jgi:hypothetical protein
MCNIYILYNPKFDNHKFFTTGEKREMSNYMQMSARQTKMVDMEDTNTHRYPSESRN